MPLLRNGAFVPDYSLEGRIWSAEVRAAFFERHQRHDLAEAEREEVREYREILAEFHAEINGDAA